MTRKFDTFKQIEALEAETHQANQQRYARKPGDRLVPPLGYALAHYEGYWYPLQAIGSALVSIVEGEEVKRFKLKKSAILCCYQHKERG